LLLGLRAEYAEYTPVAESREKRECGGGEGWNRIDGMDGASK